MSAIPADSQLPSQLLRASSPATESSLGRQRSACSKRRFKVGACGQRHHRKALRISFDDVQGAVPIEPVEPRIAIRFIKYEQLCAGLPQGAGIVPSRIVPQHGSGEEQGVDAVQHASVAGQQRARILHPRAALEHRLHQVPSCAATFIAAETRT